MTSSEWIVVLSAVTALVGAVTALFVALRKLVELAEDLRSSTTMVQAALEPLPVKETCTSAKADSTSPVIEEDK